MEGASTVAGSTARLSAYWEEAKTTEVVGQLSVVGFAVLTSHSKTEVSDYYRRLKIGDNFAFIIIAEFCSTIIVSRHLFQGIQGHHHDGQAPSTSFSKGHGLKCKEDEGST